MLCCCLWSSPSDRDEPFLAADDLDDQPKKDQLYRGAFKVKTLGRGSSGIVDLVRVKWNKQSRLVVRK